MPRMGTTRWRLSSGRVVPTPMEISAFGSLAMDFSIGANTAIGTLMRGSPPRATRPALPFAWTTTRRQRGYTFRTVLTSFSTTTNGCGGSPRGSTDLRPTPMVSSDCRTSGSGLEAVVWSGLASYNCHARVRFRADCNKAVRAVVVEPDHGSLNCLSVKEVAQCPMVSRKSHGSGQKRIGAVL